VKELIPDMVLCDIMMPKVDGYEVFNQVKEILEKRMIPFVYLTAKSTLSDMRAGMSLGADDYITKPFRAKDLLQAVETRLQKFNELKKPEEETPKTESRKSKEDNIMISEQGKPVFVKIGNIVALEAESEYTRIVTKTGQKHMIRRLLKEFENNMPHSFKRIHRSYIVNFDYVEDIDNYGGRSFVLYIKDLDRKYIVSERYSAKLRHEFGV
jgi:DNA-binding LytR/AlgR family response regulator